MNKWTIGINGKTIRDEEGCLIATLEPTDSPERDEAHARLISKAPELLEAAKRVMDDARDMQARRDLSKIISSLS